MENTFHRIALMAIGLIMVIIGVGTFISPNNLPLAGGVGVILYGIGAILNWREKRKSGFAKKTTLASAIIAMLVGLGILVGGQSGIMALSFMMIVLALWLIVAGVLEIIGAVIFRKAMTTADLGVQAPGSISSMVLGIVLILAGLFSFAEPLSAAITAGILISIMLIITGIRIIVSGIYAGILVRRGEKS